LARSGIVAEANRVSGLSRAQAYKLRKSDAGFGELWAEAELIAADLLEQEAHRRAFEGVLKPVYQKGMQVGSVREYSDKLMELLLKARKPDTFKDRKEVAHTGTVVHYNITGVTRPSAPSTQPHVIDVEEEQE
jgi:hypothetical protein